MKSCLSRASAPILTLLTFTFISVVCSRHPSAGWVQAVCGQYQGANPVYWCPANTFSGTCSSPAYPGVVGVNGHVRLLTRTCHTHLESTAVDVPLVVAECARQPTHWAVHTLPLQQNTALAMRRQSRSSSAFANRQPLTFTMAVESPRRTPMLVSCTSSPPSNLARSLW